MSKSRIANKPEATDVRGDAAQSAAPIPVSHRGQGAPPVDPAALTIDAAAALYPDEWILLRVAQHDTRELPIRGEVICHSTSRAAISRAVRQAHAIDPDVHLAIFPGGIMRVTGDALERVLAAGASRGYQNARW